MVGAGINVFAVWGYIITKAKRGFIEINPKLLAFTLGGTEAEIMAALEFLQQPDENSRSKLEDGKRLVKEGQFQYRVVNWETYDQIRSEIERRDYNRVRQQKHREREKAAEVILVAPAEKPPAVPPAPPDVKAPVKPKKSPAEPAINAEALAIYDAYPRHIARADALDAIGKALKKISANELLKKTQEYAAARAGQDDHYTPHPATWFNRESYYDDPNAWKSNTPAPTGKPNPRKFGVVGTTDYGDGVKPRLQRELEEKARLAEQMASDGGNPPPDNPGAQPGL